MDLSETLVFMVPLRPRRDADEWRAVELALRDTLGESEDPHVRISLSSWLVTMNQI